MKQSKMEKIKKRSFRDWSIEGSYDEQDKGRIWVLYNAAVVRVWVLQKSEQMITCLCNMLNNNLEFLCSAVYAQNSQVVRSNLWNEFEQFRGVDLPWLVAGDFNCIRYAHEKIGGDCPDFSTLFDFNNCLMEVGLNDLKWWGHKFTW